MYCYNCGSYNQNDDIFCYNCGVRLSSPVAVVKNNDEISEESKEKVRCTLKKYLKSPVLLIALILMTMNVVLGYLTPETVYYDEVPEYEDYGGGFVAPLSVETTSETKAEKTAAEDVMYSVLGITGLNLIWVIAGWITYFLALTKKPQMKTGGLGMASVIGFIGRIRSYIICGFVMLVVVIACIEVASFDGVVAVISFMLLIPLFGGICFLFIFSAHKLHKTMRSLVSIYRTGNADHTISAFVGVMWFASATSLLIMVGYDYLSLVNVAVYVASKILLGVQLFRLRGAMKVLAKEQKDNKIPVYAG